jgi:hypothetical protein
VALNEGLRCKKRLWRTKHPQMESFQLAPWASRRRHGMVAECRAGRAPEEERITMTSTPLVALDGVGVGSPFWISRLLRTNSDEESPGHFDKTQPPALAQEHGIRKVG